MVAGALPVLASAGCAEKKKALATELVEGVVTLDGKPLADAMVTFTPVQDGVGAPATGMSDSTGKYTLTAIGSTAVGAQPGAGTLPGEYYVGVEKDEVPPPPSGEDAYKQIDTDQPPQRPTVTHVVPQQYNNPQTSGIKATVKAGKNEIPIDLKSS